MANGPNIFQMLFVFLVFALYFALMLFSSVDDFNLVQQIRHVFAACLILSFYRILKSFSFHHFLHSVPPHQGLPPPTVSTAAYGPFLRGASVFLFISVHYFFQFSVPCSRLSRTFKIPAQSYRIAVSPVDRRVTAGRRHFGEVR